MRNEEVAGLLAGLTAAITSLADGQKQTTSILEQLLALQEKPEEIVAQEEVDLITNAPKRVVVHNGDEPLTINWNGHPFTFSPGENLAPVMFAKLYDQHMADVKFQVARAKLLASEDYLSSQLRTMAAQKHLEG